MIRELVYSDYYKGYMDLINIFTRNPILISYEQFCKGVDTQNNYVYVVEEDGIIVGSIKVFIDYKLHNNLRAVAHIEDLVVHQTYRKRGFGMLLIDYAKEISKRHNCYKTVLACNAENVEFYKKRGFIEKGVEMTIYN